MAGADVVAGIVMAGGSGRRMKSSGHPGPKALVQVGGRTLLAHNLVALSAADISTIVVVVRDNDEGRAVSAEARRWAGAGHLADVSIFVEDAPLGNFGAVGRCLPDGRAGDAVVVFCDNLTDAELSTLAHHHRRTGNDLTLAVHQQPFQVPYGVVEHHGGDVVGYTEKPTLPVDVGSGIAVVSHAERARIRGNVGIVDVVRAALRDGRRVGAWHHASRWIDVNDTQQVEVAERLVGEGWPW